LAAADTVQEFSAGEDQSWMDLGRSKGQQNIMNLPLNINDLLTARTVEWERLEFKAGWNPEAVLHTMCAFANDFHNLGGGYIIIGVDEDNGRPVLPPAGLPVTQLDAIQKEIVELGYRMVPYYHPIIAPCEVNGRHILVLWATGGQARPYNTSVSLAKNEREFAYYIRKGSITARPDTTMKLS
jgi:ATP-dependent DNA helicase RecG